MHYFDNAATTFPKPESVYKTMDDFYRSYGVNVGRGQFMESSIAANMVKETRNLMLDLFHVPHSHSCVFTASATEALNTILFGLAWHPKMNVYITPFEHNAVLRPINRIKELYDVNIRVLQPDNSFSFDLEQIEQEFLQAKPDVVILTHASNVFGNILPVSQICSLAKLHQATTICDMAQTAGLIDFDISKAQVDYAVFAGHKTLYGPFGVAGFITNQRCKLTPLLYGGTGIDSKNPQMPEEMPTKYEAGSHNINAISGLNAALKWINEIGLINIRAREMQITNELLKILAQHRNIRIIRSPIEEGNVGVISCTFYNYSSDSIGQVLSDNEIAVRTGLHCAPLAHEFAKTAPDGTVRFSVGFFTSDTDLIQLNKALQYIEMEG